MSVFTLCNNAGYSSFNLPSTITNVDYKSERKLTYLDRVDRYCRENSISYSEFQNLECHGKIPLSVLNKLRGPEWFAIKKRHTRLTKQKIFEVAMNIIDYTRDGSPVDYNHLSRFMDIPIEDLRSVEVEEAVDELKRKKSRKLKW